MSWAFLQKESVKIKILYYFAWKIIFSKYLSHISPQSIFLKIVICPLLVRPLLVRTTVYYIDQLKAYFYIKLDY